MICLLSGFVARLRSDVVVVGSVRVCFARAHKAQTFQEHNTAASALSSNLQLHLANHHKLIRSHQQGTSAPFRPSKPSCNYQQDAYSLHPHTTHHHHTSPHQHPPPECRDQNPPTSSPPAPAATAQRVVSPTSWRRPGATRSWMPTSARTSSSGSRL